MSADLTRWNRPGRARVDYVGGNAVTHLELLRRALLRDFGDRWATLHEEVPGPEPHAAARRYAARPGDPTWEILRAFARAAHIVTAHLDAYANEAFLRTATQLESARRLVSLIGYQPAPSASATTPLAFDVDGDEVNIPARTAVRHTPREDRPVVFETLQPLIAHAGLNELRHRGAKENPATLGQVHPTKLTLAEDVPVVIGDPVVLEHGKALAVRRVVALDRSTGRLVMTLDAPAPQGFTVGHTLVHADPRDRLDVRGDRGPRAGRVDNVLRLREQPTGIRAGDVVWIHDKEPVQQQSQQTEYHSFAIVDATEPLGIRLREPIHEQLSELSEKARVGPSTVVDVTVSEGKATALGDWRWLLGKQVAFLSSAPFAVHSLHAVTAFKAGGEGPLFPSNLQVLKVVHAEATEDSQKRMTTRLTFDVEPEIPIPFRIPGVAKTATIFESGGGTAHGVELEPEPVDLPYYHHLAVMPANAGKTGIRVDARLGQGPNIPLHVRTSSVTHAKGSDLIVLTDGLQLAVARISSAPATGTGATITVPVWAQGADTVFFVAATRALAHFASTSRLHEWDRNRTELTAPEFPVASVPPELQKGRAVLVEHRPVDADPALPVLSTRVVAVKRPEEGTGGPAIVLADTPTGMSAESAVVSANVVLASHGESQEPLVLGSGDASVPGQRFSLLASDVAFVPAPGFPAGVRAAVDVLVSGRRWEQVPSLRDSRPDDHHFSARVDEHGALLIEFGDGEHGRRLPTGAGNVQARYRTGAGTRGNLAPGSLHELVRPLPRAEAVRQPAVAGGGGGGDNVDDVRANAPPSVLALNRAVSLDDYGALAARRADLWQATAHRVVHGSGVAETVEVVVVPAGGGSLPQSVASAVGDHLRASSPPAVQVLVREYVCVPVRLAVVATVDPTAYEPAEVESAIREACESRFSVRRRLLGRALSQGAALAVVESVTGVEHATCALTVDDQWEPLTRRGRDGSVMVVRPERDQLAAIAGDDIGVTTVALEGGL